MSGNLGRPGKRLGELGAVRFKTTLVPGSKTAVQSVTAAVSVVDPDGTSRSVKRTRANQDEANRAVLAAVKTRVYSTGAHRGITAKTTVGELVDIFLVDLAKDPKLVPQSKERYRQVARKVRTKWLALPVSMLDAGTVIVQLEALEVDSPAEARLWRTVLRRVLRAAQRAGAVPTNVAWKADVQLRVPKKNPRAMTTVELQRLRSLIVNWKLRQAKTGPRRTDDLLELVDVMLATGCRISEALALRREDVFLEGDAVFINLTGTIVYDGGSVRQEKTKNGASAEHIHLTAAAAAAIRRRALDSDSEFLFSTRNGTPMQQQNLSRQLKQVVLGTELEWVTSHVFRKTAGTVVFKAKGLGAAQKLLRHLNQATTEGVYVEKDVQSDDHSDILEQLWLSSE
jgi:integrase